MDELGVPPKLTDVRMSHQDGSVQARYSHVTVEMRRRSMDDLTALWVEAVAPRRRVSSGSAVGVLDRVLMANVQDRLPEFSPRDPLDGMKAGS
jgi:hypothetical protein